MNLVTDTRLIFKTSYLFDGIRNFKFIRPEENFEPNLVLHERRKIKHDSET